MNQTLVRKPAMMNMMALEREEMLFIGIQMEDQV
jgi:hypothetical protein